MLPSIIFIICFYSLRLVGLFSWCSFMLPSGWFFFFTSISVFIETMCGCCLLYLLVSVVVDFPGFSVFVCPVVLFEACHREITKRGHRSQSYL